jgi:hypothetical protein
VELVGWVDRAPVQAGVGIPSSAAASAMPYWVGVKNELSVTWFTNVNFHLGVDGKLPAAAAAVPFGAALLELDELHAAMSAEAAAVALNRPAPFPWDGILSRAKPAACAASPVDFVAREITRRNSFRIYPLADRPA